MEIKTVLGEEKHALPQKSLKKHQITHFEGAFFLLVINWKKKKSALFADPFNGRNTSIIIALIMIIILKAYTCLFIYCICCKCVNTFYAIKDFTTLCSILVRVFWFPGLLRCPSLTPSVVLRGKCVRK